MPFFGKREGTSKGCARKGTSRELLWEGFRRQDLIRFGQFTDAGIWTFKGGAPLGKLTQSFRNLYPIPANELSANPNIKQNPGY